MPGSGNEEGPIVVIALILLVLALAVCAAALTSVVGSR